MTMNYVDPSELRLSGENPYMMLYSEPGGPVTTFVSLWRVYLSPYGEGHTLFLRSELTGDEPMVWTDNIMLTRWIQEEITAKNNPFSDSTLKAVDATFSRSGNCLTEVTHAVISRDDEIMLTWYDFLPAFAGIRGHDLSAGVTHGHYATYVPAQRVKVTRNGDDCVGQPIERDREGWKSSSAFLALAETWVRARPE